MARVGRYRGFSSFEFQKNKSFGINDIELVKLDILNHIFTKRGSRLMMPNFGSIIPELVFEPLDETTLEILESELTSIIRFDPRVKLVDLRIEPNYDTNSVTVGIGLFYIELDIVDDFELNIQFEA